jgi:hypothetical protein
MTDQEVNLDIKSLDSSPVSECSDNVCVSSPTSPSEDTVVENAEGLPSDPSRDSAKPSWKDYIMYFCHSVRSTGARNNSCSRATVLVTMIALAFAAYQVYLQKISNLYAERSYAINVWKDCHDRSVCWLSFRVQIQCSKDSVVNE